jgi:hypothetical protein
MKKAVRIAFALSCLAWPAVAQTPSSDDRLAHSRAVEAVMLPDVEKIATQ